MIKLLFALLTLHLYVSGAEVYATFDVVPIREASLTLNTPGIVKTLKADVGQHVSRGTLLLETDNDDLLASIDLARATLKKAQVEEEFAQQSYNRYRQVETVIDAHLMDQQTLAYRKAAAAAAEAKATLRYQESLLEKSRLRAPFSGVISERNVQLGDGVGGGIPLFRLISSPEVKLLLRFDEKYLHQIKKGASVRYRVDGMNSYRSGTIAKLYPSVDPKSRKATAEIHTSNIASGLFGEAYIKVGNEK